MRRGIRTSLAVIFIVVSLLYLGFVFTIEQQQMIGDQAGWDPGSRAVPLGLGLLMLVLSVYIFFKEQRSQSDGEVSSFPNGETRGLIAASVVAAVLYVLLFRFVGFILLTAVLVYSLSFFNRRAAVRRNELGLYGTGLIITAGFTLAVYSVVRLVSRWLFLYGRQLQIELLKDNLFRAAIGLLFAAGMFAGALFSTRGLVKSKQGRDCRSAAAVAAGTTILVYLVFKQVFTVDLAGGIIYW